MKLQGANTPRPMTHDLINDMLTEMEATCSRVSVTELRENTFYASITLQVNGREVEIDSRPSDALALAVRTSAPIFAAEDVIAESAIEFEHEDESEEQVVDKFKEFLDNVTPEDFMEEGGGGPASVLTAITTIRSRKSGAHIRSATPTASAPATRARASGGE